MCHIRVEPLKFVHAYVHHGGDLQKYNVDPTHIASVRGPVRFPCDVASLHAVTHMSELSHRRKSCPSLQVMYQLQRGPMLGQVAGHSDERALLHTCFLAADVPVALLMMAPTLYIFNPSATALQAAPALDLAIYTGECLLCDSLCLPSVSSLQVSVGLHLPLAAFLDQGKGNDANCTSTLQLINLSDYPIHTYQFQHSFGFDQA